MEAEMAVECRSACSKAVFVLLNGDRPNLGNLGHCRGNEGSQNWPWGWALVHQDWDRLNELLDEELARGMRTAEFGSEKYDPDVVAYRAAPAPRPGRRRRPDRTSRCRTPPSASRGRAPRPEARSGGPSPGGRGPTPTASSATPRSPGSGQGSRGSDGRRSRGRKPPSSRRSGIPPPSLPPFRSC